MSAATVDLRGLDLLDAAIDHIERHPETWRQDEYRCRSGMCLAGWIGELAGGTWAAPLGDHWDEWMRAGPEDPERDVQPDETQGLVIHVAERAERLIGVSRYVDDDLYGRDLFAGGNTLDDIKAMRDDLRARAAAL